MLYASAPQSPFHGAVRTAPWDVSECQPLNLLEAGQDGAPVAGVVVKSDPSPPPPRRSKPWKRSRRGNNTASSGNDDEDIDDGASSRQRRKSASVNSAENKRRDCIKYGLEELQRALPHVGTPEEEKVSMN